MHKQIFGLITIFCMLSYPPWTFGANTYFKGYNFEAYLVADSGRLDPLYEQWEGGRQVVTASEGDEYSIVVRNPLPVRVAVSVSVDGLNTIDGESNSPASSPKWLIDPYSSITIRGWQTSSSRLRRFVFSRPHDSYSEWKGWRDGRDYSRDMGIVRIAYFWNSRDLWHRTQPEPRPMPYSKESDSLGSFAKRGEEEVSRYRAPWPQDDRAGTGMGRREGQHVTRVDFDFDTGMYSPSDAINIYYRFGAYRPWYRYYPDPGWSFEGDGFSPEMPRD